MSNEPAKFEFSDDPINLPAEKHCLMRTNSKGMAFEGICVLCGEEGLPITAARAACANPKRLSQSQAFSLMIELLEEEEEKEGEHD